jgi:hypothetical protein
MSSSDPIKAQSLFAERIAKVRTRFVAKLADRLQATEAALVQLAGDGSDPVAAVTTAYCDFHDMCGISATLGFERTGQAARMIDAILVTPFRDHRALRGDELAELKVGLEILRIVARTEMQLSDSDQELAS